MGYRIANLGQLVLRSDQERIKELAGRSLMLLHNIKTSKEQNEVRDSVGEKV
jgi:hypothetical protein